MARRGGGVAGRRDDALQQKSQMFE